MDQLLSLINTGKLHKFKNIKKCQKSFIQTSQMGSQQNRRASNTPENQNHYQDGIHNYIFLSSQNSYWGGHISQNVHDFNQATINSVQFSSNQTLDTQTVLMRTSSVYYTSSYESQQLEISMQLVHRLTKRIKNLEERFNQHKDKPYEQISKQFNQTVSNMNQNLKNLKRQIYIVQQRCMEKINPIDQRLTKEVLQIHKKIQQFKQQTNKQFAQIHQKFNKIDHRFQQISREIVTFKEETNTRFQRLQGQMNAQYKQIKQILTNLIQQVKQVKSVCNKLVIRYQILEIQVEKNQRDLTALKNEFNAFRNQIRQGKQIQQKKQIYYSKKFNKIQGKIDARNPQIRSLTSINGELLTQNISISQQKILPKINFQFKDKRIQQYCNEMKSLSMYNYLQLPDKLRSMYKIINKGQAQESILAKKLQFFYLYLLFQKKLSMQSTQNRIQSKLEKVTQALQYYALRSFQSYNFVKGHREILDLEAIRRAKNVQSIYNIVTLMSLQLGYDFLIKYNKTTDELDKILITLFLNQKSLFPSGIILQFSIILKLLSKSKRNKEYHKLVQYIMSHNDPNRIYIYKIQETLDWEMYK